MDNIQSRWETVWKPQVLSTNIVPQSLAAEILSLSIPSLQSRIRAGAYPFAKAFGLKDRPRADYIYEIYPLQFVKWYEGGGMVDADLIGKSVFNRFLAYIQDSAALQGGPHGTNRF